MDDLQRRVGGYGLAGLVAAGLIWAGFVREEPADLLTLQSSISAQLGLAHSIPAEDKQGRPLTARLAMLASVEQTLAEADKIDPDNAILREFRGFLHHLRGEHRQAASCYAEARELPGVDADMHDTLVFNEARMLDAAGEPRTALSVFERHAAALQPKFAAQCCLERAALLHQLERDGEAKELLLSVLQRRGEQPMAWIRAGQQLEGIGEVEAAETAFAQAAERAPGANYFSARLKLRQGEVDRCLQLLTRAFSTAPADVRRWVKEDQSTWQEIESDPRYQQLFAAESVPAEPGR